MEDLARLFGRIPDWIRWVLVPITAAITAVLVWFLGGIAAKIIVFFSAGRGWGENFFEYLIIPGLGSAFWVVTAVSMAPRYRNMTGLVLGIVWLFLAGGVTFFSILSGIWANLISVGSVCVGTGIAVLNTYSEPLIDQAPSALPTDVSAD